ncbi:nucleotide-diphospho-sugar transferase [Punctularia strigosozonata HHB-11173 SS5]|uniref:nucleotide-diphospho-sugar transferase n=1 Tax=Punctularia strigosozonata (strain HHB-11173) TaxID=741275 RepID=UPI0004417C4C|nr:nucleotide-diphospho-sugar transferase [Punctularia strigosozonata HHB-11173 SS5]EIN10184.1 nucleotide-diphospho-sugar transferase [Punctularia strigosozonata HHB-11173 SS5]
MTNHSDVAIDCDNGYRFTETQDWFSFNIDAWRNLFPTVNAAAPCVLEIGSWEGRSAVFLLTELCKEGGSITCIDHFDLHKTPAGRERYAKIMHNLAFTGKPFRVMDDFSFPALMKLLEEEMSAEEPGFDWVYVDGSHEADDTLLDGELAWRLARKGAIFIFDDYKWNVQPVDGVHHPKRGIDAFMSVHRGEYEVLSSPDQYQMVLRKSSDMRIGFLVKDRAEEPKLAEALGYGVNVALAVDSAYAMPAAVCMRSAAERTSGRVTFYVVDCGMTEADRDRIEASVPQDRKSEYTVQFVPLPADGVAAKRGSSWAKLDVIRALPVERVLYLDADVLVRGDVRVLWDTDLRGKTIGACIDVGHPNGHADIARGPYYNAGVMLVDLSAARRSVDGLLGLAESMTDSKFQDQDVLNAHFEGEWMALDLRWNAQGLGTYAGYPSEERASLDFASMKRPEIVHFTGPVHPTATEVLNPWVQPYTSKPWGYVGAPGHPFAREWWEVLEKTAWQGYRNSDEFKGRCKKAMEDALGAVRQEFAQKVEIIQEAMFAAELQ